VAKDRSLLQARDKDGSTPLHCAVWKGHVETVRFLLDAGADINDHNQNGHWGTTPLHAAAHGDQRAVAELLITRGADIHAKNLNGRTPLEETAIHNASSVAKLLTSAS
jgi:ankyrin repeat protein